MVAHNAVGKSMTVGEVIARYPEAVEVMLRHGLHCVGCHVNPFDTIENGCVIHGISKQEQDEMIEEINAAIALSRGKEEISPGEQAQANASVALGKTVVLTDKAADKISQIMQGEGKAGSALRVALIKGGCAGHSYYMEFEPGAAENDAVEQSHGITILVEKELQEKVRGTVIDFQETLNSSGFTMRNPNAKRACGCGQSFSV